MRDRQTNLLSRLLCPGTIASQIEPPRRMSHRLRYRHRGIDQERRRDGDEKSGNAEGLALKQLTETCLLRLAEFRAGRGILNEQADARIASFPFGSFNHLHVRQPRSRF